MDDKHTPLMNTGSMFNHHSYISTKQLNSNRKIRAIYGESQQIEYKPKFRYDGDPSSLRRLSNPHNQANFERKISFSRDGYMPNNMRFHQNNSIAETFGETTSQINSVYEPRTNQKSRETEFDRFEEAFRIEAE